MTRGRIWDVFQPDWSIFKFYLHIPFDLGCHGQYGVWKNARHVYLKVRTFLCILIYEFPNTNKMGTGLQSSLHYIFIPEKYVIRVLFVCPWTSLIPLLPFEWPPGLVLHLESRLVCTLQMSFHAESKKIWILLNFEEKKVGTFYLPAALDSQRPGDFGTQIEVYEGQIWKHFQQINTYSVILYQGMP